MVVSGPFVRLLFVGTGHRFAMVYAIAFFRLSSILSRKPVVESHF